ncbi:DUF484 family protein [Yoonia sp. I 8.24]|uniref:DUF484 family protein n=1 Tax=Yoonia sp. I 8.24 TaxID=1537229 RepID=UPI001EDD9029|nr:DUF484 family protein [Yoonia sp. I 8.24]
MSTPEMDEQTREKIIANPNLLLEDHDIMRALVGGNDDNMGGNIVDLRGIAMERLEARFDRLEDTHRNVIAAAYDNLAGTNQVHRAILRMMDAQTFTAFLEDLTGDVANTLRVDAIRLVLESADPETDSNMGSAVAVVPEGFIDDYITLGRNMPVRQITLRKFDNSGASLYGERAGYIQSEACLKLDLGTGNRPGMLIMGSEDPQQFSAQQGTDLLTFFTGVFERVMQRWLG